MEIVRHFDPGVKVGHVRMGTSWGEGVGVSLLAERRGGEGRRKGA